MEDLISVEQAKTLDGLFISRIKRSPDAIAYIDYDRQTRSWKNYTWHQMQLLVERWQALLQQQELHPGDRVAIKLRNSPEWVAFDQAALGLGLVVVPLYTDDRPENIAYILQDADVKLLLLQDAAHWKRIATAVASVSSLQQVFIQQRHEGESKLEKTGQQVSWLEQSLPESTGAPLRQRNGKADELASIVYTSGTTGKSKGVMLSHHNLLSIAHASLTVIDCYTTDIFLSFLPLSHTLERTAGYYLPVMAGATVAYSRSIGQLADDLGIIRPTVLIAVPRIFERVYGRIQKQLENKSFIARALFRITVAVGWQRFQQSQGRARWSIAQLSWPLLHSLVADKVAQRLGGRLRLAVSGGAALSPDVARLFIGLGIPVLQGYGLTETSPVISVNPLEDNDPASVGVPLKGLQVKIGPQDELLVKSPGIMLGYWNNHTATAKMIDADGWLHTGDQARIENNHIYITGRIKDILVLSNGEKVPPGDMELAIALDPVVEQVLVVGEGRPYLTALIVLDGEQWPQLAQGCGVDPMARESLAHPRVISAVTRSCKQALKDFPGYAKIRKVNLMLEPWTVDNGLITPTLKVKRPKVLEKFAAEIKQMYHDGPAGEG